MKYLSLIVLVIGLSTATLSAQTTAPAQAPAAPVEAPAKTGTTEKIKLWFAEAFATTEVFRLKQAKHFTEMRDAKNAQLKIDEVPEIDENITTGTAGINPAPRSQTATGLQNPLEYGSYILSISLASLFNNQVIFYLSSALLAIIILRFIVSRLV
ncbi:MAG TPA: hypothetical protein VGE18_01120 [Candidatus Paceibacterota bacterium]